MRRPYRVGIDLGGSKILVVLVDQRGRVVMREKRSTKPERGYRAVLERIADTVGRACQAAKVDQQQAVAAYGLGVPGVVLPGSPVLRGAVNLGWDDQPIATDLAALLGDRPLAIGNDVNLGALGETTYGAARGVDSAFAVFMGTGLGGALILDGRVVTGAHGLAGEIGHIPGPFDGAPCGCGQYGCLETMASKTGLVRLLAVARTRGLECRLAGGSRLKSSRLRQAWHAGCPATTWAVARSAEALGWGLGVVTATCDPTCFILGGGVLEALGDEMRPAIERGLTRFGFFRRRSQPPLLAARLGDDAVAIGAAVAAGLQR